MELSDSTIKKFEIFPEMQLCPSQPKPKKLKKFTPENFSNISRNGTF